MVVVLYVQGGRKQPILVAFGGILVVHPFNAWEDAAGPKDERRWTEQVMGMHANIPIGRIHSRLRGEYSHIRSLGGVCLAELAQENVVCICW